MSFLLHSENVLDYVELYIVNIHCTCMFTFTVSICFSECFFVCVAVFRVVCLCGVCREGGHVLYLLCVWCRGMYSACVCMCEKD